jgi:hypothetical protein
VIKIREVILSHPKLKRIGHLSEAKVAETEETMIEDVNRIEVGIFDVVHHHVLREDVQDQGVGAGAETRGIGGIVSTALSVKAIQILDRACLRWGISCSVKERANVAPRVYRASLSTREILRNILHITRV